MTVSPDLNISKQAGHGILYGKVFLGTKSASKGTYTVEFAIVAAALFLLMFAILDVAILCFVNLTMQNAVREGARYAITGRSDLDPQTEGVRYRAVVQKIKDSSMGFFDKVMNEDDITVTDVDGAPVAGFGEPGQTLVITLDCTWPLLTPLVSPFFPEGDYKFTVGATMRNEAFPRA